MKQPLFYRKLANAGVAVWETLTMTDAELMRLRGFGEKCLRELREAHPPAATMRPDYFDARTGEGFEDAVFHVLLPVISRARGCGKDTARLCAKLVSTVCQHAR